MALMVASIVATHPRELTAGVFVLCGLYLLGSVCVGSATGEMAEGRESGPTGTVLRDTQPRRFAFMLGTCVFGACVCFASAAYVQWLL